MKRMLGIVLSAGLVASAGLYGATAASASGPAGSAALPKGLHAQRVCGNVAAGRAHCMSLVMVDASGKAYTSTTPNVSGFGPADLQDAYKLPSSDHGKGMTVGIVDAFDNPNVEADLQVYRNNFGLPKCTTSN